ncbi:MAG: hypothetical protein LUF92_05260 [Clostridiales bacterium]|nr:hypothetical protein [Clostridiales bacterium]
MSYERVKRYFEGIGLLDRRMFKGVSLDYLAVGEKSIVCKMKYVAGNFATALGARMRQGAFFLILQLS